MASRFIIEASELNFEFEVLKYSQNVPVVVYFWASWCQPCKVLDPILSRLTEEARGGFRLAKVDVDENPTLVLRYGIRTIPTVKAISQEEVVSEFVDIQPEKRIREFLSNIARPSPLNLAIEKADSLLNLHEWANAELIYRKILEQEPDQPSVLLGLAKTTLAQGKAPEAIKILGNFPPSRQFSNAKALIPLAESLLKYEKNQLPEETDLDFAFENSIRLAKRGNIYAAIDGLLDIIRQERRYRQDLARNVIIGLLDLLSEEDPQTRQYRSELAIILF
jgi:putative thioredoxin